MKTFVSRWSVLQLLLILVSLGFFILSEDKLLFKTDLLSLVTFFSGLWLLLLVPSFVLAVVGSVLGRFTPVPFTDKLLTLCVACLLALTVLAPLENIYMVSPKLLTFALIGGIALLSSLFIAHGMRRRIPALNQNLKRLAAGALLASVVAFPLLWLVPRAADLLKPDSSATPLLGQRGVVLVIVDELGASYVSAFNKESPVPTPNIDRLAADATLFTRYHVTNTQSNGNFRTLYSGQYPDKILKPHENLLHELQKSGAKTRVIASHNNAMPDASEQSYRGLRSAFLTQYFAFLPRWLGLDYNILRYRPAEAGGHGRAQGNRESLLLRLLNARFEYEDPFSTLLDEIERFLKKPERFFVVLHLNLYEYDTAYRQVPLVIEEMPEDPELQSHTRIQSNYNHYSEEDRGYVEKQRERYKRWVAEFDRRFGSFLKTFELNGWGRDVALIFTSSHGFAFDNGNYADMYHVTEEVTWAPLIVQAGAGKNVRRPELSETIDVSATVADLLGVKEQLNVSAMSLIANRQKLITATFGHHRFGWQVAIYHENEKYVFHVMPDTLRGRFQEAFTINPDGSVTPNPSPKMDFIQRIERQRFVIR